MSLKKPSQMQLYGQALRDASQYQRDLARCLDLTSQEEQELIERARAGERQAREDIIVACYPYSQHIASKYARLYAWASARLDACDLMQVGMLRAVECCEKALAHARPFGYLLKAIHGAIVTYCLRWCSLIQAVQDHSGTFLPGPAMISLDAPLQGNPDETMASVLEDQRMTCPHRERDYSFLYEAIETLVPRQRDAVTRYYGIGCAAESYEAIGRTWNLPTQSRPASYASTYEQRGIAALKRRVTLAL